MTDFVAQVAVGGTVVNLLHFDSAITLSGGNIVVSGTGQTIPPGAGQTYFIQDGAKLGWTVSGGTLISPGGSPTPPTAPVLNAYAKNKSESVLQGGFQVTLSGTPYLFATNPISLAAINSTVLRLGQSSPPTTVPWPYLNGPATLSAANFLIAAGHLFDWMMAVEAELATVYSGIIAVSITTRGQIDSAAWPANHYP